MDHQDHNVVILRGKSKKIPEKKIVPRKHVDLNKIKIENETENFTIKTIPKKISTQISQCRVSQKMTQKDMAAKLCVPLNSYTQLENGKAQWNGTIKQLVNKIQNMFGVKFTQ